MCISGTCLPCVGYPGRRVAGSPGRLVKSPLSRPLPPARLAGAQYDDQPYGDWPSVLVELACHACTILVAGRNQAGREPGSDPTSAGGVNG